MQVNMNSWHWRVGGSKFLGQQRRDVCAYIQSVIGGLMEKYGMGILCFALFFGIVIPCMWLVGMFHLHPGYLRVGGETMLANMAIVDHVAAFFAGFLILFLLLFGFTIFGFILTWIGRIANQAGEKLIVFLDKESPPGFIRLWYRSWQSKTCTQVELVKK